MAKKFETVKLIASLEKAARTTKKGMWKDLAERLTTPSRNNIAVNVEKINYLAKKNKGKTLLVIGKVLSQGELSEKVDVVAISVSAIAKTKINASGKFTTLAEFVKSAGKVDLKKIVLVK